MATDFATRHGGEAQMDNDTTVFVIDDDSAVLRSLHWLIESVGLNVECFDSAKSFLAKFDLNRSGCIVLDVRMPGMSGLDLHDHLRAAGCQIPVIMVSAVGDIPIAVRAMKNGAIDFLEKPVSDQVLLDQINRALRADLQQREANSAVGEIAERFATLTKREREVIRLVVQGLSSKEVAQELKASFKTVEAHRAKIMKKMNARSVAHLMHMSLRIPELRPK